MLMISIMDVPKKEHHRHAHGVLRECLKKVGVEYVMGEGLSVGEHGKPYLTEHPEIHFNLSHADGIAACIIGENECGIDCEGVRQYRPNVTKRAFTEKEKMLLENAPDDEKNLLFFRLWTLKESYIKAIGMGLSFPLNEAEFSFEGNEIHTNITGWMFKQYILKNGRFVVSTCEKSRGFFS